MLSVDYIKRLGREKCDKNLHLLLNLFNQDISNELKREVVSSIGRQKDKDAVYTFILNNMYECNCMDIVYQMYRTLLYNLDDIRFAELEAQVRNHFNNEVINKMYNFHIAKGCEKEIKYSSIKFPKLLEGDCHETIKQIRDGDINLIFTSPPYYNAREYSSYKSYNEYLDSINILLKECYRVLENGRFIIINVSPVISKRPGREFESIRYPIHFDIHRLLVENDFQFIDEIIWIKPEASVPNRVGGYLQTKMPLSYKPNCITESLLVYRKNANFLIDHNIKRYSNPKRNDEQVDTSNCWYISPKSNKIHPAIFPEELCEKILKYYSFEGDVILDMYAGSGTLGRVAIEMNRIPVLCEYNVDYINYIKETGVLQPLRKRQLLF